MTKKELIKIRLKVLLNNKEEYRVFNDLFMMYCVMDKSLSEKICENKNINMCEFLRSRVGSYMNSFYYSLILYNIYKEMPGKILTLVNKVLSSSKTVYKITLFLEEILLL